MKVVINRCHGGFGLSKKAVERYHEIKGRKLWVEQDSKYAALGIVHYWLVPPGQRVENREHEWHNMTMDEKKDYNDLCSEQNFYDRDLDRSDSVLVQVVKELGADANGRHAELAIVDIPDDVQWQIEEYDGLEWVAEAHRTWG